MLIEVFISQGRVDKFSDIRLGIDVHSIPTIGDEISFQHHNNVCEETLLPKSVKYLEAYDEEGNSMDGKTCWTEILYHRSVLIERRILNPDTTIEFRGKLIH